MWIIRDLLAIIGSIGAGWFVCGMNHYAEKGAVNGMVVAIAGLIVTVLAIRTDQKQKAALRRKLDQVHLRNTYLEAAIKQGK